MILRPYLRQLHQPIVAVCPFCTSHLCRGSWVVRFVLNLLFLIMQMYFCQNLLDLDPIYQYRLVACQQRLILYFLPHATYKYRIFEWDPLYSDLLLLAVFLKARFCYCFRLLFDCRYSHLKYCFLIAKRNHRILQVLLELHRLILCSYVQFVQILCNHI